MYRVNNKLDILDRHLEGLLEINAGTEIFLQLIGFCVFL